MPRGYLNDFLHNLVLDIVSERRDSPLLTVSWVAEQAVRAIKTPAQRITALREGIEAVARDVLVNSNPARYRVSRWEEFQYVPVEQMTDGELLDLVKRVRQESLASCEAALRLQATLAARSRFDILTDHDPVDGFGVLQ